VCGQEKTSKLGDWPTVVKPFCESKKEYRELLGKTRRGVEFSCNAFTGRPTAMHCCSFFQGWTAAGKDGAIQHVMTGVNPEGCQVYGFKQPSADELEHDFLWRATCRLPERGRFGNFNRSYYEEVLVVRVHPEILRSQGWRKSCATRIPSGTTLSLHRRPGEPPVSQRNADRQSIPAPFEGKNSESDSSSALDDPHKNWKFSLADIQRGNTGSITCRRMEACLHATSTVTRPTSFPPTDKQECPG